MYSSELIALSITNNLRQDTGYIHLQELKSLRLLTRKVNISIFKQH